MLENQALKSHQREFIEFALKKNVLKFGQFTLKSGRISPYFFNAGLFDDGLSLANLGRLFDSWESAVLLAEWAIHCCVCSGVSPR